MFLIIYRKPPPTKSKKDIQREIRDVIRQITASVTFLPLLEGQCKCHELKVTCQLGQATLFQLSKTTCCSFYVICKSNIFNKYSKCKISRLPRGWPASFLQNMEINLRKPKRNPVNCMEGYVNQISSSRLQNQHPELPLGLQAIAKRVDTLPVVGYILDTHHCIACPPPPSPLINVVRNSR